MLDYNKGNKSDFYIHGIYKNENIVLFGRESVGPHLRASLHKNERPIILGDGTILIDFYECRYQIDDLVSSIVYELGGKIRK